MSIRPLVMSLLVPDGVLAQMSTGQKVKAVACVLAVAVIAALVYVAHCVLFPYTACGACDGGKDRDASRRNWRLCRSCGGTGRRIRFGRRVYNWFRSLDKDTV